jgi:hypothetical protein
MVSQGNKKAENHHRYDELSAGLEVFNYVKI